MTLPRRWIARAFAVLLVGFGAGLLAQVPEIKWAPNDPKRPNPPVIQPPTASTQQSAGRPPSDAVVLFDGEDLSAWEGTDGGPAKWKVQDGYMQPNGTGDIRTKKRFGDCQLHIEWAATEGSESNSGVYLMSTYEIQVYNSFKDRHEIYADGQAAGIYGQHAPLVNASRKPGKWQSYDIVFHRPHFEDGKVVKPATMTVFHNGVLVHDHVKLTGPTRHKKRPPYSPHAPKKPLLLQDHGDPVRYRQVWIRPLSD